MYVYNHTVQVKLGIVPCPSPLEMSLGMFYISFKIKYAEWTIFS